MVGFEHVGAGIEDGIAGKGRRLGDAVDAEGGDIGPSSPWRVKSGVGRAESVLPIVTIRVDRKEAA